MQPSRVQYQKFPFNRDGDNLRAVLCRSAVTWSGHPAWCHSNLCSMLPFVCFPFSIAAVLGNCKQYQHSPEIIRLPHTHALLKALQLTQKNEFLIIFFFQINYMSRRVFGTYLNETRRKSRLCRRTESTLLSRLNLFV